MFFKLTADQVLVFDWIEGSCQINLLKTGQEWAGLFGSRLTLGLKFIPIMTFSSIQMFFAALF